MDILGVGPLEFFFIIIIALIVLGPRDMVKAGRSLGRFLRRLVTSPTWQVVQQTSRDFRNLPNRLMREAALDEELEDLNKIKKDVEEISKGSLNNIAQSTDDINKEIAEVNKDIKETHKEVKETQKDLSAWTTPPVIDSPPPPGKSESAPSPEQETIAEDLEIQPHESENK